MGTAAVDESARTSFSGSTFQFPSDGTMNPLGESMKSFDAGDAAHYEDVFGASVLEFDVWDLKSPGNSPKKKKTIPKSKVVDNKLTPLPEEKPRRSSEKDKKKKKKKRSKSSERIETPKAGEVLVSSSSSESPKQSSRKTNTLASAKSAPELSLASKRGKSSKPSRRRIAPSASDETPPPPPSPDSKHRKSPKTSSSSSSRRCKSSSAVDTTTALTRSPDTHPKSPKTSSRRRKSSSEAEGSKKEKSKESSSLLHLAPTLDPQTLKTPKKNSSRRKSVSEADTYTTNDRIGELMNRIRKENGAEKSAVMSSLPVAVKAAEPPSDPNYLRKLLLEDKVERKSYLPKKVSGRVYGSDFRKVRRESVKDSLQHFLKDAPDPLKRSAGRSVVSAPVASNAAKVRPSRSSGRSSSKQPRTTSNRALESHLRSTRVSKNYHHPYQDNEYRSVVSAPAKSSSSAGISERCLKFQMEF